VHRGLPAVDHHGEDLVPRDPEGLDEYCEPGADLVAASRRERDRLAIARAGDLEDGIRGEQRAERLERAGRARSIQLREQALEAGARLLAWGDLRHEGQSSSARMSAPIWRYASAPYGI